MKKITGFMILIVGISFQLSAQNITKGEECNFFGPINFKNGKATVIIKATYNENHRDDEGPIFKQLEKQKKLFSKDYFTRCCSGGAISFTPENCLFEYSGTINLKVDLNQIKFGQTVYLTCTLFEGFKSYDTIPFFVIDKIDYKKGDVPKADDIKPLIYIQSKYINQESGCGYFSNSTDSLLGKFKCVLTITPHYLAFIQTADKKFIYFSFVKRILTENGYIDIYNNSNSSFQLNINQIINTRNTSTYRNGRLSLILNNTKIAFNVYGIDEEHDKYNSRGY